MDFSWTDEQRALRAEVIDFARAHLNAGADERDRDGQFPRALWPRCGAAGLLGLCIPRDLGGRGVDALSTAVALEALGYACTDGGLVFSIAAQLTAVAVPMWKFGTPEQQRALLPALCDGSRIGAAAMTEAGSGSDVFAMRSRATLDGDHLRLSGSKQFITNVPEADVLLVYAMTGPGSRHLGASALVVEAPAAGLRMGGPLSTLGLRSAVVGELHLDDVRLPRSALLGAPGAGAQVFAHAMDWERVCLFAAHVGAMQRLIEHGVDHARSLGRELPAGDLQQVKHRLAELHTTREAARLLVYRAAADLARDRPASLAASMAKLFVGTAYADTARAVLDIRGGEDCFARNEIERAARDAAAATIYSGSSEMQREIIARWLGM